MSLVRTTRVRAAQVAAVVLGSVAVSIGGAAHAGAGGDPDLTGSSGWWQFDWDVPAADETSGAELLNGTSESGAEPIAVFGRFDAGIERALRIDAEGGGLRVGGSDVPGHVSDAAAGPVSFWTVLAIDAAPSLTHGDRTLAGRWQDAATGQWRLVMTPAGTIAAEVRTSGKTVRVESAALSPGERTGILLVIDGADGTAKPTMSLIVVPGTGVSTTTSAPLAAPPAASTDALRLGDGPVSVKEGGAARVELAAVWNRTLDADAAAALAGAGSVDQLPIRYATVAGWRGIVDPSYRTDRIAGILQGHVRHVMMGDSFAWAAAFRRVMPQMPRVAPFEPFVAVATGLRPTHAYISASATYSDPAEFNPRELTSATQYRCEYIGGTAPQDFYGLPANRAIELRGHAGVTVPSDGRLMDLTLRNTSFANMASDPLAMPGDHVAWRLVHRRPGTAPELSSVQLAAADGAGPVELDLTVGIPRQASWSGGAAVAVTDADGQSRAAIFESASAPFAADDERFLNLVGVVASAADENGTPARGQYITSLHDTSWTLSGFAADAESGAGGLKVFSGEQLAHWLDATTLAPDRRMVFWWYVDAENRTQAQTEASTRAMIDVADAACDAAGLARPVHLLIVPHMHSNFLPLTRDQLLLKFQRYRDAFDAVADDPAYDHVARISIGDATDMLMFDGRDESVEWLVAGGYDAFRWGDVETGPVDDLTGGDLLDDDKLHPGGVAAAAFFASVLADEILSAPVIEPCRGDADGDGVVDFADLILVLERWGPCPGAPGEPCPGDLDASGAVALPDLLEVLAFWGTCVTP